MIRFSAFLVVVAVGLLVAGVVTSKLLLIYIAIGVSGVALLALGAGAVIKRSELFGQPKTAESELGQPVPVDAHVPTAHPEPQVLPQPATVSAGSGWSATEQPGPSLAGYLPTDQPPRTQPTAWGSGIPPAAPAVAPAVGAAAVELAQASSPGERAADVQRPPAAFMPRTADQQREQGHQPAGDQPSARDDQAAEDQLPKDQLAAEREPAETKVPAEDQLAAEDHKASEDQGPQKREQSAEQPPGEELSAPAVSAPAVSAAAAGALAYSAAAEGVPPEGAPADSEGEPPPAASTAATAALPAVLPAAAAAVLPAASAAVLPAASAAVLPAVSQVATQTAEPVPDLQREVTVVPGVPRYHNARCILIRFMGENDLEKMTLGAARKAGCTPCRACLPDQPEKNPELGPLPGIGSRHSRSSRTPTERDHQSRGGRTMPPRSFAMPPAAWPKARAAER